MCGPSIPKVPDPITPAAAVKLDDVTTELALSLKAPKKLKNTLLATGSDAGSLFSKSLIAKK